MNPQAHSPKQKTPFGSPDPSWGIATGTLAVTTRAPVCSGLGAPGEAEVACPASPPLRSVVSTCPRHPPGGGGCRGVTVCAARAVTPLVVLPWPGLGWVGAWPGFWTRDIPKKPTPGGRSLLTPELSDEEALPTQNLPESFLSGKLEAAPLWHFPGEGAGALAGLTAATLFV